jgi:two-component sensor histidine kinase
VTKFVSVPSGSERLPLMRELDHRIHNEFTSAINFISVDAVRADEPGVKTALCNVVELLHSFEDVNRILSMPVRDTLLDGAEYLQKLALTMGRSRLDRLNIHLLLSADTLLLESNRCWRLGLIVHELLANSVQHACFDGREGKIRVELTRAGEMVNCTVSDNGSWPAKGRPGRGLKIVHDLAKSLGGRIEHTFVGSEGTSFVLAFALTAREQEANRSHASRRKKRDRQLESACTGSSSVAAPPITSEPLRQLFAE